MGERQQWRLGAAKRKVRFPSFPYQPFQSCSFADIGAARHVAPMHHSTSTTQRIKVGAWLGAGIGAIIAIPAIFAAIVSGGAGHGTYIVASVLFPFSMLLTRIEGSIGPIGMAVGVLQLPLYGAVAGRAVAVQGSSYFLPLTTVHLVAVIACFSGLLPNFS
jgi:hypothetical protein